MGQHPESDSGAQVTQCSVGSDPLPEHSCSPTFSHQYISMETQHPRWMTQALRGPDPGDLAWNPNDHS